MFVSKTDTVWSTSKVTSSMVCNTASWNPEMLPRTTKVSRESMSVSLSLGLAEGSGADAYNRREWGTSWDLICSLGGGECHPPVAVWTKDILPGTSQRPQLVVWVSMIHVFAKSKVENLIHLFKKGICNLRALCDAMCCGWCRSARAFAAVREQEKYPSVEAVDVAPLRVVGASSRR